MDIVTLEKLHKTELEILDEFVRMCNKHNLTYFLVGGTLLGAVRHKGFIPWDDDIDIGMPRDDYELFIKISKHELNKKYYLQSYRTYKYYWLNFAKIRKNNTCFIEDTERPHLESDHRGIFIDIFPYDNIFCFEIIQKIQGILIQKILNIFHVKRYKKDNMKNIYINLKKRIYDLIPYKLLHLLQNTIMKLGAKNHYFISWGGRYEYKKEIFNKNIFFPLVKIEFEKKYYNAPNNSNFYLTQLYGNYIQLPPPEERKGHDLLEINFDVSANKKRHVPL
jgi:lipopolysaccharide cholinephosphotransferase